MLVLTRKPGQSIRIGDDVTVTLLKRGSQYRLAIAAPKDTKVLRAELKERK